MKRVKWAKEKRGDKEIRATSSRQQATSRQATKIMINPFVPSPFLSAKRKYKEQGTKFRLCNCQKNMYSYFRI
ncbi:MAG: hypothetical protein LBL13_03850 [Bacteroidales bacterium]|jgi:hypothetical protein|nr:hypothetical protein [Bacteroidales bacterium]